MNNTSIRLFAGKTKIRDSEGYAKEIEVWGDSIPASRKDSSRNDEILASQKGYTATAVYSIASVCYSGESELKDDADGSIYKIRRDFRKDKSMKVELTCEFRERGKHESI